MDIERLRSQMATLMIMTQVLQQFVEVGVPYFTERVKVRQKVLKRYQSQRDLAVSCKFVLRCFGGR